MRHLLNLGPSTFSGQTGASWAASKNIQEGFWWQEMSSEDLLAMGSHGGQGALFCSGYNCSSQRTEKPLDMETTATPEMAPVPLLRDAIFENLGDSAQFFKHFLLICC